MGETYTQRIIALLEAMDTDTAANEILLTAIAASLDSIDTKLVQLTLSGNALIVDDPA
jgi:hypothetical protein